MLQELTSRSEQARALLRDTSTEQGRLEQQAAQQAEQEARMRQQQQAAAQQAAQQQQQRQQQQQQTTNGGSSNSDSGSGDNGNNDDTSSDNSGDDNYDDSGSSYVTPSGGGYLWPTPNYYVKTSEWNEDRYSYNHGAIDIGAPYGALVIAADSGTVSYTCSYCTHNWGKSSSCGCGGGYGNYVWINHGNGKETIYAHLTSVLVQPGQYVNKGDPLGYVGSTGYSTGPHLHFECRYNGVKYNPDTEF